VAEHHAARARTIHTVPEVSALTSFAPRWIEELQARYNALGP
jgi:hypothetical protein